MGKLSKIQVVVLFATLVVWCNGVQFYDHPVPIPYSSYNNNEVDPAVQFLVNNEDDGSYHFGYDTGGNPTSYREEIREKSGRITGRYAYINAGILRVTEYVADETGFHSTESEHIVFDNSDLQLIGPIPKPSRSRQFQRTQKTRY